MKEFVGARGAIDETHVYVHVKADEQHRSRSHKGAITQNVLIGCTFHLYFCYVLPGWEGSAHEARVSASKQSRCFPKLPANQYYLADAGYGTRDGILTPFKKTRYHLREQEGLQPLRGCSIFGTHG